MADSLGAIVLAAGKGTRMKSDRPKVLHEIAGRPLISFPVNLALELASPVVVVVGHGAEQVRTALGNDRPGLTWAVQRQQRGTADAVLCAREALARFRGRLLILYGDVPLLTVTTLKRLLERRAGPLAFLTARLETPQGYGRVVRDAEGRACRIVEERDCSPAERALREINAGVYSVEAGFLWKALGRIDSANAQRELYLTDLVGLAAAAGGAEAVDAEFDEVSGVNDRAELARAAACIRTRLNLAHQLAGVTLVSPEDTYIDASVRIGRDVTIEPGCVLTGMTRVADGARIRAYSVLEDAEVGPAATVGPFARLRPGTVLGPKVEVGNFAELKNTRVGAGSKAHHHCYLGDAELGERVNVGAGTITCNYDGVRKNQTRIGDAVFIGSDSQLVAPVTLGDGAYVGAGSTVTEDVPANALALSRVPQTNVPGWATRRRAEMATKPVPARKGKASRRV